MNTLVIDRLECFVNTINYPVYYVHIKLDDQSSVNGVTSYDLITGLQIIFPQVERDKLVFDLFIFLLSSRLDLSMPM